MVLFQASSPGTQLIHLINFLLNLQYSPPIIQACEYQDGTAIENTLSTFMEGDTMQRLAAKVVVPFLAKCDPIPQSPPIFQSHLYSQLSP
jgi:hypothetical protein